MNAYPGDLLQVVDDLLADGHDNFYDAVLQPGDFAYDFRDDEGRRGDEYMRLIEPLVARAPFMVSPGNHENHYNFSHYKCVLVGLGGCCVVLHCFVCGGWGKRGCVGVCMGGGRVCVFVCACACACARARVYAFLDNTMLWKLVN